MRAAPEGTSDVPGSAIRRWRDIRRWRNLLATLLATTPGSVSKSWPRPWTYDGKGVVTSGLTAWSRQTKPGMAINTISICLYLLESQDDN